ncbi:MAG: FAD:protein FMN transferase, partial [Rhodothalassiaceae bacterium]
MTGSRPTRRTLLIAACATALAASPAAAFARTPRLYRWRGMVLGGEATLLLGTPTPGEAEQLAVRCRAEITRLERIFSLYRPDSALVRLNAAGRLAAPPPEMLDLLALSRRLWEASGGAFDPSIQPLWQAWSSGDRRQVEAARALVGLDKVIFDPRAVRFARAGMALSFNGIAQGFITDRVTELLAREGLGHALVSLGETRALGTRPDGTAFAVAIEVPEERAAAPTLALGDGAALAVSAPAATVIPGSGGATHLLDPRTGIPLTERRLVVVLAPTATKADGLASALSVLGPEVGLSVAAGL